jgi:uncharacterized protein YecE (DUF72 family)
MPVLVGTSGWQYRDWKGVLYPPGLPQRRWLEYYASQYATVENNGTFYRLPRQETFADWCARTPEGFVMAVKASRYLTHVRRDPGALDACLRELAVLPGAPAGPGSSPAGEPGTGSRVRVAVECRHESWWSGEVRDLLARHNATLCWADRLGRPVTPLWRTADWGYLRFHEGAAQPWPRYGQRALRRWAGRLADTWPDDADVFVFFNNDPGAAAIYDAAAFASIARQAGRQVSRTAVPGAPAP